MFNYLHSQLLIMKHKPLISKISTVCTQQIFHNSKGKIGQILTIIPLLFLLLSQINYAQVNNGSPKNYILQVNNISYDPTNEPGLPRVGVPTVKFETSQGTVCESLDGGVLGVPPLQLTPVIWNPQSFIVDKNDDVRTSANVEIFTFENFLTGSLSYCRFSTQVICVPPFSVFGSPQVCTTVDVDRFPRMSERNLSTILGEPGRWTNSTNVAIGGSSFFNYRSTWRHSNGDAIGSALDFGTIRNAGFETHTNSNRIAPSGAPVNKGYTNKLSFGAINTGPEVVYRFRVTGSRSQFVTLSTDFPGTDFDTEIHLLNGAGNTIIESDDDGAPGSTKSLIERVLEPGTYFLVVEGFNSTSTGDFVVGIRADNISYNSGSISQPAVTAACFGASLPGITSNQAASTSPSSDLTATYTWFRRIGSGNFTPIPGATSASLTSTQAGTMGDQDISFRRVATLDGVDTPTTNTVTVMSQANFGEVRIINNNGPVCSGENAVYTIESTSESDDAGAVVSFTLNGGSAQTITLDAGGQATITDNAITSTSSLQLVEIRLNDCMNSLSASKEILVMGTPIPLACGETVNGNNASGTSSVFSYDTGVLWRGKEDIYEFTVTSDGEPTVIELTGLNSTGDLDLHLTMPCDPRSEIDVSDEFDDADERIEITLDPGTYWLIVDGFEDDDESPYTLSLQSCGVKAACDNIIEAECFETISDVITSEQQFYNCGITDNGILYKITPEFGGAMTLNLTGLSADLDLVLYTDICGSTCNEISSSTNGGFSSEQINFTAVAGTCYYVRVFGFLNSESSFDLEFDCPAACPCTDAVDYVEAIPTGDVCLGTTGSYTIQAVDGADLSPGATVSYSLNGGATQTVVLDANGEATISDTPTVAGNPGSSITLSRIEFTVGVETCSILLDNTAEFAVNQGPNFVTVFSNGPVCAGAENGKYFVENQLGAGSTANANIIYELNFFGQAGLTTIVDTIKSDEDGIGIIEIPATTANTPSSQIFIIENEINGCVTPSGTVASITTYDSASQVNIFANAREICPGDDAIFTLNGTPGEVIEYDDANSGSAPANPQFVVLDGSGNGTITIPNPTDDVRIDIYRIVINPFGNDNNTFPFCDKGFEYGDNFAEVTIADIADLDVIVIDQQICVNEGVIFQITPAAGSIPSPGGTVDYMINGVAGTIELDGNGEAIVSQTTPTSGTYTIVLNSLNVPCNTGGCDMALTGKTAVATAFDEPHDLIVTGNGPLCIGDTPMYTIGPAVPGQINANGEVTVMFNQDQSTISTFFLDANGEVTISPPSATQSSSIDLLFMDNNASSCAIELDFGANIDVYEMLDEVEVFATGGPVCRDSLLSYTIQPAAGSNPMPGALVEFMLNGVLDTTQLDDDGLQEILATSEFEGLAASTIQLVSIFNPGCSTPLTSSASTDVIDCGDPCYEYMVRNFSEEEAQTYQVNSFITSSSSIASGSTEYLAGDFISLEPGFEVSSGVEILCDINPCPSPETCGEVSQKSGLADVPNEFLNWDVVENICVEELVFSSSSGSTGADIQFSIAGFVSGNSGPFNATVTANSPAGNFSLDIVVPNGQASFDGDNAVGFWSTPDNRLYFVNLFTDYDGVRLVEATIELEPF